MPRNISREPLPQLETYANNLTNYIKLLNMKKVDVAREIGVDKSVIVNICKFRLRLPTKLALRFQKFAGSRNVEVDLNKIIPPDKWDVDFKNRKWKILKLED